MWREKSNFFHIKFIVILTALCTMILFVVLTGVIKVEVLEKCHAVYWVLLVLVILFMGMLSTFSILFLKWEYNKK